MSLRVLPGVHFALRRHDISYCDYGLLKMPTNLLLEYVSEVDILNVVLKNLGGKRNLGLVTCNQVPVTQSSLMVHIFTHLLSIKLYLKNTPL